jgi:hypothetical protein
MRMRKERSDLNEELLEAISTNIDSDWDDIYGGPRTFYTGCANECEIICLETQIRLLSKIKDELNMEANYKYPFAIIQYNINRLQNQIDTITELTF